MGTLLEDYNLRYGIEGQELKNRFETQLLRTANYILIEDVGTANHAERLNWASVTLRDPKPMVEKMFSAFLGDAAIASAGSAATDLQIEAVVAAKVNTFAVSGV